LEDLKLTRPLIADHEPEAAARKRVRYREDGNYAIRDRALQEVKGDAQGQIVILMPLTEYHRTFSKLRSTILAIACLVFVIACFISYRFSSSFTRPIAEAVRFAKNLAAGDRNSPININRSDELGMLQESLEKMRIALQGLFGHMDARIQEGMRSVTNILDNLESGFLIFDREGIIQPGYSRISEQFFGTGLSGKRLGDILDLEVDERNLQETWLEVLFGGTMAFKKAAALGPGSFNNRANRQISLTYRPIRDGESLQGVILIATDKTHENELARRFAQELERVKMILRIASNREAFQEFIADCGNLIDNLEEQLSVGIIDLDAAFRTVHTLKGNSGMFHCLEFGGLAHDFESEIAGLNKETSVLSNEIRSAFREKIDGLRAALARLIENTRALLGKENDAQIERKRFAAPIAILDELDAAILERFQGDSREFQLFHDIFVLDSLLPALQKYEPMIMDLALRRGKELHPVEWTGEEIRIRMQGYKRLASSFVHAFRNVVDHGIEEPQERKAAGKDPQGRISVAISKVAGSSPTLRIRISDDGRGIDPEAIRTKLIAKGNATRAEADAMDDKALYQSLFTSGFSTSPSVTDTSGRGVGLDAIAHEAERLNGKAWIEAQRGRGTTLFVEVSLLD
jgi:two-component system chemotaxis sensor kinase CheA